MSEHWYDQSGKPCYEIIGKNGKLRATTIRDARQMGYVPSVTTVLSVIAKPALENWKVEQGILAALTLERLQEETDIDYLKRVMQDSKQQAIDAADEGTRIHDAIEQSFKGLSVPEAYQLHVNGVREMVKFLFPDVSDWISEASFAHPWGYGGKVDLHSPSTGIVIDFKGKDGDFSDKKRLAYDQHWQLAAYQRGLNLPHNKCANIFFSRTHPGKTSCHVWNLDEIFNGDQMFTAALTLWKCMKGYDPAFKNANEPEDLPF